ncbi:MAG: homoserine O-acetyltransferase [Planctomycetota bacterium]
MSATAPSVRRIDRAAGTVAVAAPGRPLALELGGRLDHAELAYELVGPEAAPVTVVACHALTGDAHATGHEPEDRPGWWDTLIGPGLAVDTGRVRVLCANVLGGCSGSTGPGSTDPATGRAYGDAFPPVTIRDMVAAQIRLVDALDIRGPLVVLGGSIGGFQAIEWAVQDPVRVRAAGIIASGASLGAFGLAFNSIARRVLGAVPGDAAPGQSGMALARQLAHLTYRTSEAFDAKFARRRADDGGFEVDRYLHHRGRSFEGRFEPASYRVLLDAMDQYDALAGHASLSNALSRASADVLIASFDSDWLFPPRQGEELAAAARDAGLAASWELLPSVDGHDAFLLPHDGLSAAVARLIERVLP